MERVRPEILRTIRDWYIAGLITQHAMKSLKGQIYSMSTHEERELYLQRVEKTIGRRRKVG